MAGSDAPINLDTPMFSVSLAASAAGLTIGALRVWLHRYDLRLWEAHGEVEHAGGSRGATGTLPHKLTLRTVLHIAATAGLVAKGAKVQEAYVAAMRWTHVGAGQGGFVGPNDRPDDLPHLGRTPAGLYPAPALTLLIYHGGTEARVLRVPVSADGTIAIRPSELSAAGAILPTIINLNELDEAVRRVCTAHLDKATAA